MIADNHFIFYECRQCSIKRKGVLVLWDPSLSLRDDTVSMVWGGKKWRFVRYHLKISNSRRIATSCHIRPRIYLSFRALARNLLNNNLNYY